MDSDLTSGRYFWWSGIRLDSDPLNRHLKISAPCQDGKETCAKWELEQVWIDPGWIAIALVLSAFPAFLLGRLIVMGLGKAGISQVTTFMITMPVLIFAWYYFIGWLLELWRSKRENYGAGT